jgi:hypothetical protein
MRTDVERIAGLSNPNAMALIGKLTTLGILEEITGRKRNKIFACSKYIDVFNHETASTRRKLSIQSVDMKATLGNPSCRTYLAQ